MNWTRPKAPRHMLRALVVLAAGLATLMIASRGAPPLLGTGLAQGNDSSNTTLYIPLAGIFDIDDLVPPATVESPDPAQPTATVTTPRPTEPSERWSNFAEGNGVTALYFDADANRIWAGSKAGLVVWDLASESYRKYTVADGLGAGEVLTISADGSGSVWIGTIAGASRLNGDGSWTTFDDPAYAMNSIVHAIAHDAEGGSWFGTDFGLSHLRADGSWEVVETVDSLIDEAVVAAATDATGRLWFGTSRLGLAVRDPDGSWWTRTTSDGLPSDAVYSFTPDAEGGIWVGTEVGFSHHDVEGRWRHFTKREAPDGTPFPLDQVTDIAIDAANDQLWLIVQNSLYSMPLDGERPEQVSAYGGRDPQAVIDDPNGGIWIGTPDGLLQLPEGIDGPIYRYRTDDALPDNRVEAIETTADGGAWVATESGLAHMDGSGAWSSYPGDRYKFEPFESSAFAVAPDGAAWIGGIEDAVIRVDTTGEIRRFGMEEGFPLGVARAIAFDAQGGVWFGGGFIGSNDGEEPIAARLNPDGSWTPLELRVLGNPPLHYVLDMMVDSKSRVWLVAYSGLYRVDPDGRQYRYSREDFGSSLTLVQAIAEDGDGQIWLATTGTFEGGRYIGGGLSQFDGQGWRRFDTSNSGLVYTQGVNTITFDTEGALWAGTDLGVSRRSAGGAWTAFNAGDGLPEGAIRGIQASDDGSVWAMTVRPNDDPDRPWENFANALARYQGDTGWAPVAVNVAGQELLGRKILAIGPDGGVIVAGPETIARYDGAGGWAWHDLTVQVSGVTAIAEDEGGDVWLGSSKGLTRWSPQGTWRAVGPWSIGAEGQVERILFTGDEGMWLARTPLEDSLGNSVGGGLSRREPDGSWTHFDAGADGLRSTALRDLALAADGSLWIAGEPSYDEAADDFIGGGIDRLAADGSWTHFGTEDGLPSDWVTSIVVDPDGRVWAGTDSGIGLREPDGSWRRIGRDEGLESNNVNALVVDHEGRVWAGTSDSATRFDASGSSRSFSVEDGMAGREVLSMAADADAIWFGHDFEGLSRLASFGGQFVEAWLK